MEKTIRKEKKSISPIWIIPLISLIIGAGVLYKSVKNRGIDIILKVETATGITVGKTQVMFKGIPVGIVQEIGVASDLKSVDLGIKMIQKTEKRLVEDTIFWVVKPEVSASKISGLETILSGSYIGIYPGSSTVERLSFVALPKAPILFDDDTGLRLTLVTNEESAHSVGSPILYKKIKVGEVKDIKLMKDSSIQIDTLIFEEYTHFINESTVFWDVSGIKVKADLPEVEVSTGTLKSLISGGITFETPIKEGALTSKQFPLYKDYDDATHSDALGLHLTLMSNNGSGHRIGSPILYKKIKVGEIKDILLNDDSSIQIKALIFEKYTHFVNGSTVFWDLSGLKVKADLPELEITTGTMASILSGGITFETPKDGVHLASKKFKLYQDYDEATGLNTKGLRLTLTTNKDSMHRIGSPILYKKIKVGEVKEIKLNKDSSIQIEVLIFEKYTHFVNGSTLFWDQSGVKVKADLPEMEVQVGTLKSILNGGITFTTPKKDVKLSSKKFKLYQDYNDATYSDTLGLRIILTTDKDSTHRIGSPILYKKIKVGEVKDIQLKKDGRIQIKALIFEKYTHFVNGSTLFWDQSGVKVKAALSKVEIETGSMKSMLNGGITFTTPEKMGKSTSKSFKLYKTYDDAIAFDYVPITFNIPSQYGVEEGALIKYRNIEIGKIQRVVLDEDLESITATASVLKNSKKLLTANSYFWIVRPKISLSGVSHLDSLISGAYVELIPREGDFADTFVVHNEPPVVVHSADGLGLTLVTSKLGSVKRGNPVNYRQVKVGEVVGSELSIDRRKVLIYIDIFKGYENLISPETKFWNVSGVVIEGGVLSKMSISTESIETIMAGGIAFSTPTERNDNGTVSKGDIFELHGRAEKSWLDWDPGVTIFKSDNESRVE